MTPKHILETLGLSLIPEVFLPKADELPGQPGIPLVGAPEREFRDK